MKTKIEKFMFDLQQYINQYFAERYENLEPDLIGVVYGKKYAKITACPDMGRGQKMVHCFIDMSNGDILKAASWKAPAKGVRGNIETCVFGVHVTSHGAAYK